LVLDRNVSNANESSPIRLCETKKDWALFEQAPELIMGHEKFFVPPFPGSISKIIKKDSFFDQHHGKILPFLYIENGKVLGRIAAIINNSHTEYYKDKLAFFGYFDCVNDPKIANALFSKVEKVLREKGFDKIRGPLSPSIHDECGALAGPFDSIPCILMPYNPAYYLDLYENNGFKKARDLYAYWFSAETASNKRVEKIVERIHKRAHITLRTADLKNIEKELVILKEIYNRTLNRNWGFYPLTLEDVQYAAGDLKTILDADMIYIAEIEGKPVGFSMCFPNINEIMWRIKGSKSALMRTLRFIWQLKIKPSKEKGAARLAFLGVLPEYQNLGIAPLFYYETFIRGRKKFTGGELSWVEETNKEIIHGIEFMGGEKYKTYRVFEKDL
jgi:GNAT superfamily N-acetyltransferase